ncbi:MAG: RND transporter [Pseudomonadota bacterium]
MTWLDRIPLWLIAAVAVWLAVAPLLPEPHLVEKLRMLAAGTLRRPLDIFDLLFHLAPIALLALKLVRVVQVRNRG